jgi:hypothetical protein
MHVLSMIIDCVVWEKESAATRTSHEHCWPVAAPFLCDLSRSDQGYRRRRRRHRLLRSSNCGMFC